MEQILMLLKKLERLSQNDAPFTRIEKDIMLQYTRDIYDAILQKETIQTEEIPSEIGAMIDMVVNEIEPSISQEEEEEEESEELVLETEDNLEDEEDRWIVEEEVEDLEEKEELDSKVEMLILPEVEEDEEPSNHLTEPQQEEKEQKSLNVDTITIENFVKEDARKTTFFQAITDFKVWDKDIRTYIGINDKYNFISELFGNNAEAYDEILNEINLCENKKDALVFLENSGITTLYSWKEDGFSEQIFHNVLSQFFSSR
jgi:hypothetical protein